MTSKYSKIGSKIAITSLLASFLVSFFSAPIPIVLAATAPELPRVYVDTTYPTLSSSRTIRTVKVSCAGASNCYTSLQTAINQAVLGDEIVIDSNMSITGPIVLKNKTTGSGWIVIRTSDLGGIPTEGNRVGPQHAAAMPNIIASGSNVPAISTEEKAHNYRLVGIEVTENANDDSNVLIQLGTGDSLCATAAEPYKVCDESVLDRYAYNLILDRMYIHGLPTHNVKRGVSMDSKSAAVIDSYISDIHTVGQDTQAIAGMFGPGPYKVVNNYLEGAAENVMFGGDDPRVINLSPSDIEIRKNHLYKPLSWRYGDPSFNGRRWSVKNIFELKNAQRVLVDGNIMENLWTEGQSGIAVYLTTTNQSGRCLWCTVTDVTFTNNIIRHAGGGLAIQANDYEFPASTGRASRFKISNNLFYDLDSVKWKNLRTGTNAQDYLFYLTSGTREPGPHDVEFSNNTAFHSGSTLVVDRLYVDGSFTEKSGFVFKNNIAAHNQYGIFGEGASIGEQVIQKYFPSPVFTKNVIWGQNEDGGTWNNTYDSYPGNYHPKTLGDIGFMDAANANYRLSSSSPYKNVGTDGKDLGVDMDQLDAAVAGVITGSGTPQPTPTPVPTPTPTPTMSLTASASSIVPGGSSTLSFSWTAGSVNNVKLNGSTVTASCSTICNGTSVVSPIATALYTLTGTSNNGAALTPVSVTVTVAIPTPPPPTPTPTPVNQFPVGSFDEIRLSDGVIRGWSLDPDSKTTSNIVHIFFGGPVGSGALVSSITTNVPRADINSVFSTTGNHGFEYTIPSSYRNGASHSVYIYGIDVNDSSKSTLLTGSPKSFTLTPTTTDTTKPVISAFDVQPRTSDKVNATFTVTDTGGSNLKSAELVYAQYNSTNCNMTNLGGCSWIHDSVVNAPASTSSWNGSIVDTPAVGTYLYGVQVFDKSNNKGYEPYLIQVTIVAATTPTPTPVPNPTPTPVPTPVPVPTPTPTPGPSPSPSPTPGPSPTPVPVPIPIPVPVPSPSGNYIDGTLLNDSGTIFVIENGKKRGFTTFGVFIGLGYKYINVTRVSIPQIPEGPVINSVTQRHPRGSLINDRGTIYFVGAELRYPFPSAEVFYSWGRRFIEVVNANNTDLQIPIGPIVQMKP